MKAHVDYDKAVRRHKARILGGKMVTIDPSSSSNLGWAIFLEGKLQSSGSYTHNGTTVYSRLLNLAEYLRGDKFHNVDVVVIEKLYRSRTTPTHLLWSIGTILAALPHGGNVIECPIALWRRAATAQHLKLKKSKVATDKQDAEAMGQCVIQSAMGGQDDKTTGDGAKRKSVTRANTKRTNLGSRQTGAKKASRRGSGISPKKVGSSGRQSKSTKRLGS